MERVPRELGAGAQLKVLAGFGTGTPTATEAKMVKRQIRNHILKGRQYISRTREDDDGNKCSVWLVEGVGYVEGTLIRAGAA
jgi:hypothetical protein